VDYQNTYYELGEYANDLISGTARTLIGKAGFTSADCEDTKQELALDLLARLEDYEQKKSNPIKTGPHRHGMVPPTAF